MTTAGYWKQVREACAKTTPGPWYADDAITGDGSVVMSEATGFRVAHLPDTTNVENHEADAAFIALSRTALPLALARIEELKAAMFIAQQMSNCVYNALQNNDNWERAKKSLAELLPQFDAALGKP